MPRDATHDSQCLPAIAMELIERLRAVERAVERSSLDPDDKRLILDIVRGRRRVGDLYDRDDETVDAVTLKHIQRVVDDAPSLAVAARRLGINRTTLYNKRRAIEARFGGSDS